MLRFFTGILIGFISTFLYLSKREEKNLKNKTSLPEDTTKIINVMKEFQKMKERI